MSSNQIMHSIGLLLLASMVLFLVAVSVKEMFDDR